MVAVDNSRDRSFVGKNNKKYYSRADREAADSPAMHNLIRTMRFFVAGGIVTAAFMEVQIVHAGPAVIFAVSAAIGTLTAIVGQRFSRRHAGD